MAFIDGDIFCVLISSKNFESMAGIQYTKFMIAVCNISFANDSDVRSSQVLDFMLRVPSMYKQQLN